MVERLEERKSERDHLSGGKDFPRLTMYSGAFNASLRWFQRRVPLFPSWSRNVISWTMERRIGVRNARNLTSIRDEMKDASHYRANEQARPSMERFGTDSRAINPDITEYFRGSILYSEITFTRNRLVIVWNDLESIKRLIRENFFVQFNVWYSNSEFKIRIWKYEKHICITIFVTWKNS